MPNRTEHQHMVLGGLGGRKAQRYMKMFFQAVQTVVVGAVVVSALFVIGAVIPIDGLYDMRVVMSGSMKPDISVGSVIAYAERDVYTKGDVIVFEGSGSNPTPITHRIVDIETEDGETRYVTKGDANEDPDHRRVKREEVLGAVFLSVPYVGYLASFLDTPLGFAALIGIPVVLLVLSALREIFTSGRTKQKP